MAFITSTDIKQLEAIQAETDVALGYPEQEHQFVRQGFGPWCDWTVGRAFHYAPIDTNEKGDTHALPITDKMSEAITAKEVTDPTKIVGVTVVDELPIDWYPTPVEVG